MDVGMGRRRRSVSSQEVYAFGVRGGAAMRKLVLLLVGFALVVAACGGDEEETTDTEPTTETVGVAVDATTEPTVASADDAMPEDAAMTGRDDGTYRGVCRRRHARRRCDD